LDGRNSNTEHLKRSKENQKAQKEDQDAPDDPEYGAGKH
jgi:hypothetical protein